MTSLTTLLRPAEPESSLPSALKAFQQAQRARLDSVLIPTRKTENWKYSARRLGDMRSLSLNSTTAQSSEQADKNTIIIENGQVLANSIDISGVSLKRFDALNDDEAALVTQGVIARSADLQFAHLNHAEFTEGVFISVADNTVSDEPLRVCVRHSSKDSASYSRIFVALGKLASLTVIEELSFADLEGAPALLNCVTDISLSSGARMNYVRSDMDQQEQSKVIGATGVLQQRDSFFESHCLGLGTQLDRHDFRIELAEPGSECNLNGVCVTQHSQHYDNHTSVEHIAPNCQSNESYRCIAGDQSQIVFNGRIHIHRDAQKTLGSMSNKNLLLSNHAEIDSKPELEIYADDVKCAHGTTIGQLDEQEIYYLKTRGIKDEQARQMLTLGFVLELVRANPVAEIATQWEDKLSSLLSFEQ